MTAPPPERGRRPAGREPDWRAADQAGQVDDEGYDEYNGGADYPADGRASAGPAGPAYREQDSYPGYDAASGQRSRSGGRHSRRPRPDRDYPDADRYSSGGQPPARQYDGGDGYDGRRRSRPDDPYQGGYPPDGGRQRPPAPPGRPAGYTDPAAGGRWRDQFPGDSWYRDSPPSREGRPGRSDAYQDPGQGPNVPAQGGPPGPQDRPGPRSRDPLFRPPGSPRPDADARHRGGPSPRQVPRGSRTWADYQDKPYAGAAYGYVEDADQRRPGGAGPAYDQPAGPGYGDERGPAADDNALGEGAPGRAGGYGFTAALGNYRGPAEPDPIVYEDPRLSASVDQQVRYQRTRHLDLPDVLPTAGGAADPSDTGQFAAITGQFAAVSKSSSVLRSSGVMAVGTLGSRLTGFLRTIAQSYALGTLAVAGAYNVSNTLPNVVYNLALGGILTSVIVPLIVNAKKRDPQTGRAYEQRMFTMVTAALLAVTLAATALTVPIVHAYSDGSVSGATEHLTILFAYFFIPQIFFYGVSSLIGAVLNTRGSFAAPMWTPILNNAVVIVVLGLYVAVAGLHRTPHTITPFEVRLLGLGTTLGVVVQTLALVPALRKVGFRWQPRTDFRQGEVSEIGRMAGWMFCYIGATQVAFLVTIKVAEVVPQSAGVTEYNYAWLLFQLPYAVVGISVITALLPRMSSHASAGQVSLVRTDFSSGIRLAAAIVVPCSLVLAVLGPAVTRVFLAHGAAHAAQAHTMGIVFAVFCLGLLPYMIFQLQLRVFYSFHDSKTPAIIGLATMTVNIITNLLALLFLRHSANLVAGLGVGFGLANLLGSMLAWRILSVRMRGLDGYAVGQSLARMHVATLPAVVVAFLAVRFIGTGSFLAATATLFLGGGGALVTYVLVARALHIRELATVTSSLRAKLGR